MEEELTIELCAHSYNAYDDVQQAAVGEELLCECEARNMKDML